MGFAQTGQVKPHLPSRPCGQDSGRHTAKYTFPSQPEAQNTRATLRPCPAGAQCPHPQAVPHPRLPYPTPVTSPAPRLHPALGSSPYPIPQPQAVLPPSPPHPQGSPPPPLAVELMSPPCQMALPPQESGTCFRSSLCHTHNKQVFVSTSVSPELRMDPRSQAQP